MLMSTIGRGSVLEVFDELDTRLSRVFAPAAHRSWFGATDVVAFDDRFEFHADLPGVSRENIELVVDSGVVTIAATRTASGAAAGAPAHTERNTVRIERRFRIGHDVDVEAVTAHLDSGVLTVTIPRAAASRPHRIEISSADAPADAS